MRFKLQTKTSGNKWEYIKLPFKFYYSDRMMSRTFLSVLTDDYQSNWQLVIGRTDVWATQSGNNWWLFRICVICLNPITAHNEMKMKDYPWLISHIFFPSQKSMQKLQYISQIVFINFYYIAVSHLSFWLNKGSFDYTIKLSNNLTILCY